MDTKLAQFATLSQKDKGPAYLSLLSEIISRQNQSTIGPDLHTLVDTVVNQDNVGLVVGRQVLSELVKALGDGMIRDVALRKDIVKHTLDVVQPRLVSYEEQVSTVAHGRYRFDLQIILQVNSLRFQLADLLEVEEDWSEAARVLMNLSLDSGQRYESCTKLVSLAHPIFGKIHARC
jgi:COP9 signalosome complex subunit 4